MVSSRESHLGSKVGGNFRSPDFHRLIRKMKFAIISILMVLRSPKFGYLTPILRGPKRPKLESRKSIETEPKTHRSGLLTAKSVIGILIDPNNNKNGCNNRNNNNRNNNNRNNNNNNNNKSKAKTGNSILTQCWLTFLFAASLIGNDNVASHNVGAAASDNRVITIATHNLHGFSTSSKYLKDCIQRHGDSIWLVQEHWLSESKLHQLQSVDSQFVARSGMEDAISSGVYRGRPFGGVAICWSPDLNQFITPVTDFKHKRIVAVIVKTNDVDILLICAYLPFFNASNRQQCMNETIDAISMIELLIDNHPNHHIIIGGDLNTELKGESPFDPLWREVITKNRFACCDNLVSSPNYTYRHDSLNQMKFNDHFIVSQGLLDGNQTKNHRILDEGDNNSDHLPLLMEITAQLQSSVSVNNGKNISDTLNWKKISAENKARYSDKLEELLLQRQTPLSVYSCAHPCGCQSQVCRNSIQQEYDEILTCISSASSLLPRSKSGVEKDWWSQELTLLRNKSIAIQELWINEGRPRQGPTHQERLHVRAAYKNSIRQAKRAPKQTAWNRLHTAMETQDSSSFWKWWRSVYTKNKRQSAPVIDGQSTAEGIAGAFQTAFEKNGKPNNQAKVDSLNAQFYEKYEAFCQSHTNCDCAHYNFTLEIMTDALYGMRQGKSPDNDGIHAEHFQNGPMILLIRLTSLFNVMLSHGFVPNQFRLGTMIPIIKDTHGNASDVNNYRGITISPIPSKIFEHLLKNVFSHHLTTSSYQFGFKTNSSTSHAIFALKETINYYIDHGSRVYSSFLDASKAFDRLVHSGLFLKLMQRCIPKCLLDILITWYDGLQCRVKWEGYFGNWFPISAGVRQGGILSPDLYSIYVDGLITILQASGIGCYTYGIFAAALFYADDMCILSPSLRGLQKMLDICSAYCLDWDICLNPKKTRNMFFGKSINISYTPTLNGAPISWADEWKYLGVVIKSGRRFGCSVSARVKSFYRSLNSILRVGGISDDIVLLRLVEAHCVPILAYAIEVTDVANRDERRSL